MDRKQLLDELIQKTEKAKDEAVFFKSLDVNILNQKPSPDSWSILECLEHLNRYGDYYLKEIESRILDAQPNLTAGIFKPGLLGNYFVNVIRPNESGTKKMKTAGDMNPVGSKLSTTVIDRFLKQQDRLISLLRSAEKVDLTKVKTSITLSKWIKLRLGDTLRFVVYHNERHLVQAQRVLKAVEQIPA